MEDYKEKHEQALERCKKEFNFNNLAYSHEEIKQKLERVFPELKESEDKKIKKSLIGHLKECRNNTRSEIMLGEYAKWIAWLEKQGEQKSTCILNNSKSNVKFPFKAKVKSNGKIVTIHGGQLSIDCKEWIKYQSDVEDGYMVYRPEDLELVCNIEQKPTDKVEPKFKVGDWITIKE